MRRINEMEVKFVNKSVNEGFARTVAALFAMQLNPTIEKIEEIKTAVSEAVTNAIIHGYEGEEGKYITLSGILYEDMVEFAIADQGKGIVDVERARKPLFTSKPELERSGMGFTVMENFMDEVVIETAPEEGTKVIMRKKCISQERNRYGGNSTREKEST